jgi:hypothetical protein
MAIYEPKQRIFTLKMTNLGPFIHRWRMLIIWLNYSKKSVTQIVIHRSYIQIFGVIIGIFDYGKKLFFTEQIDKLAN